MRFDFNDIMKFTLLKNFVVSQLNNNDDYNKNSD